MEIKKISIVELTQLITEEVDARSSNTPKKTKKSSKHKDAIRIKNILLQILQHPASGDLDNNIEDIMISPSDNVIINLQDTTLRTDSDKDIAVRLKSVLPFIKLQKSWFISPAAYLDDKKEVFLTISSL